MNNILENVVLLNISFKVWSGRRKLTPADLKLADGSELPPESLARLGSKRVIDPQRLNDMLALRTEAHRLALSVGTRLMGGYAVPQVRLVEIKDQLDALVERGKELRSELLKDLSSAIEEWKVKNPGWEALIERANITPERVESATSFSWQVYHIQPCQGEEEGLSREIGGMAGQLRHEIEVEARSLWKKSFQGRTEVGQKAIRPIRTLLKKMDGLSFLEEGMEEYVKGLQDLLTSLPKKGPLTGGAFAAVCGIVSLLGNIPEAAEAAEAAKEAEVLAWEEAECREREVVEGMLPLTTPPPLPPPRYTPPPEEWF